MTMAVRAAALLFAALSVPAYADDHNYEVGAIPTYPVAAVWTPAHQAGSFTDTFHFQLDGMPERNRPNVQFFIAPSVSGIDDLLLTLYWASPYGPVSLGSQPGWRGDGLPSGMSGSIGDGDYRLVVTGTADAPAGGQYQIDFRMLPFPAPVPEPQTWMMLLAGACGMGLRLRGRIVRGHHQNAHFAGGQS